MTNAIHSTSTEIARAAYLITKFTATILLILSVSGCVTTRYTSFSNIELRAVSKSGQEDKVYFSVEEVGRTEGFFVSRRVGLEPGIREVSVDLRIIRCTRRSAAVGAAAIVLTPVVILLGGGGPGGDVPIDCAEVESLFANGIIQVTIEAETDYIVQAIIEDEVVHVQAINKRTREAASERHTYVLN